MYLTPRWRKTWMSREEWRWIIDRRDRCMWATVVRNSPVPPSNGWKKVTIMNYFIYFYTRRSIAVITECRYRRHFLTRETFTVNTRPRNSRSAASIAHFVHPCLLNYLRMNNIKIVIASNIFFNWQYYILGLI